MLSDILFNFSKYFKIFWIFKYITVRASVVFIISFILTLFVIKILFKNGRIIKFFRQPIKKFMVHHKLKSDTPVFGGIVVGFVCWFSVFLFGGVDFKFVVMPFILWLLFFLIGFVDDYLKFTQNKGLTIKIKLVLQILSAILISVFVFKLNLIDNNIQLLFFKDFHLVLPFGLMFLWFVFIIVGLSNSVNIADGLDGLTSGLLIQAFFSCAVLSYLVSNVKFANYLNIAFIKNAYYFTIISSAFIGGLLGFLWYNFYPADLFIGDSGALSLGALLGYFFLLIKHEFLLLFVGFVFFIEMLSVTLQVISFRFYGKRVFKMAPLHHHLELTGLQEPKVVLRLWIVNFIMCMFALLTLKLR